MFSSAACGFRGVTTCAAAPWRAGGPGSCAPAGASTSAVAAAAAAATCSVLPRSQDRAVPCLALHRPSHKLDVRCQSTAATAEGPQGAVPATPSKSGHAVVVGAGLAGLTAAKALAAHFARMTVLERDEWAPNVAEGADLRPGVPQFQQPHILLARGIVALDSLLGDFRGRLQAAGGVPVCFTYDFTVYDFDKQFGQVDSAVRTVLSTRSLYEQTARAMLLEQEQAVALRSGASVAGLVFEEGKQGAGKRVTGVRLKDGSTLGADLVVDASGRTSGAPDWLAAGGLPAPQALEVDGKLGYATRFYERPAEGPVAALVGGRPFHTRGGVVFPVEGNRWHVIIAGYAGDYPPSDEDGWMQFIRSLPSPIVANMLEGAKPLTPISRYLGTRNQRRLYEKLDMPAGFVVMGDAVAVFNPIYGQGITVGVLEAQALEDLLSKRLVASDGDLAKALEGLPNEFQRRVAAIVNSPWTLAVSEDSKWAVTESNYEVPRAAQLVRPYFNALAEAASRDPSVLVQWSRCRQMLDPPALYFAPNMVLGALWYGVLLPQLAQLPLLGRYFAQQEGQAGGGPEAASGA